MASLAVARYKARMTSRAATRADRLYAAATCGQIGAFFAGFLGAVYALAHGSATGAASIGLVAVAIIVACSKARGAIQQQARAKIERVVTDAVVGRMAYSDDDDCWEARVILGDETIGFRIGGDTAPAPELVSHARDIIGSAGAFRAMLRAFLDAEAEHLVDFADEIRALDADDVCLFWPDRPDDGMIFFRGSTGRDDRRLWRCDYVGRKPKNLGFDS